MDDTQNAVLMYAKNSGDLAYLIGATYDELGGSQYLLSKGLVGNNVPKVDVKAGKKIMDALSRATHAGFLKACHDCSEGGLAVAAAEMAFSGGLGMEMDLEKILYQGIRKRDDVLLFSESNTRFVVEVGPQDQKRFEQIMRVLPVSLIGRITAGKDFVVYGLDGNKVVDADIYELKEAWQAPLRW